MHLCKFFKFMIVATVVALSYIHMQMQIIDLAYQGNQKEARIKKLIEENGDSTYRILMLKSANHLGVTMLDEGSDMQFADAKDVVRITGPDNVLAGPDTEKTRLVKKTNPLRQLLSFGVVAEARSSNKQ